MQAFTTINKSHVSAAKWFSSLNELFGIQTWSSSGNGLIRQLFRLNMYE